MGKIPTIAIIAIVAVLLIGMSVAAFYFLIKPKQVELASLKGQLKTEQDKVNEGPKADKDLAAVNQKWLQAQEELAALRERKSIHISMHMPLLAMTALWYEYRDDLPAVLKTYFESQGVEIEQGAAIPAPPVTPPTMPANWFMPIPSSTPLSFRISGSLGAIERVYRNLSQLPRIATIGSLSLSGTGERLSATVPLSLYLLVEGPDAPAAPAAAAGGAAGPGGAPGMGPGGPPGAGGAGGESKGEGKSKGDGEDASAKPKKGGGDSGDE